MYIGLNAYLLFPVSRVTGFSEVYPESPKTASLAVFLMILIFLSPLQSKARFTFEFIDVCSVLDEDSSELKVLTINHFNMFTF